MSESYAGDIPKSLPIYPKVIVEDDSPFKPPDIRPIHITPEDSSPPPKMVITAFSNSILVFLTDTGRIETWIEAFPEDPENGVYGQSIKFGNRSKEVYGLYARLFIEHINKTSNRDLILAISLKDEHTLPKKTIIDAFLSQTKF